MTAFARAERRDSHGLLVWEIRSVNHRYLECFVRLPEELRALEPEIREQVKRRLARGKLDCSLRFNPDAATGTAVRINQDLARKIAAAAGEIAPLLTPAAPPTPMDVLRWPGVVEIEPQDISGVQAVALDVLDEALEGLVATRQREGRQLAEMIAQRCTALRGLVQTVRVAMPEVLSDVRQRLRERLEEVREQVDAVRLEEEMALLAQRLDVDEEMDRLETHLDEVERVLARREPVGRRLDFLMQELNREANTLTSKSGNADVTRHAVEMKVLVEQMREQVQNIE
jgi:uncharacterized protein (TIGR00255 family)